jgi:hypothetical protein
MSNILFSKTIIIIEIKSKNIRVLLLLLLFCVVMMRSHPMYVDVEGTVRLEWNQGNITS